MSIQPIITRRFEFDAGHRVLGHEGKCANLHGHRYVAEVTVAAQSLDTLGRVVDFSVVKETIGTWIDVQWDHNILLHQDDPLAKIWAEWQQPGDLNVVDVRVDAPHLFGPKAPYIFPDGLNPTVENLAYLLFKIARRLTQDSNLPALKEVQVLRVKVWETPNCWAEYPCLV